MNSFTIQRSIAYMDKYDSYIKQFNSKLDGITCSDGVVKLDFIENITEQEMTDIIAHDANFVDLDENVVVLKNGIIPARKFGQALLDEYAAENVVLGILQAGLSNHVRKASREVMDALYCGSLYDAIYEIRQIPEENKDPIYLCNNRLLQIVNKIETYLEINLSTEL